MTAWNDAADLLVFYMRQAWEKAGIGWEDDNSTEIRNLVRRLEDGARAAAATQAARAAAAGTQAEEYRDELDHRAEASLLLTGDPCEYGCPHSGCPHEMRMIARAQVHATLALTSEVNAVLAVVRELAALRGEGR